MDRPTVATYDRAGPAYAARRHAQGLDRAVTLGRAARSGAIRADLGCGPGFHLGALGAPVVGLDASAAMLGDARGRAPAATLVLGDLESLPFRDGALAAAWASRSYVHVPAARTPLALRELHRATEEGAVVELTMLGGDSDGAPLRDDDFPGRRFTCWPASALCELVEGAGFAVTAVEDPGPAGAAERIVVRAVHAHRLADTISGGMRLLLVGLNPSPATVAARCGYAGRGNRFWPAALAAGVLTRGRDQDAALVDHGVGMTNLVLRCTRSARELRVEEYRAGTRRLEHLVARFRPGAVGIVGLTGWRAAVDPRAQVGVQAARFAGAPVYVMPNPSGLNTHVRTADLAAHLAAAATLGRGGVA